MLWILGVVAISLYFFINYRAKRVNCSQSSSMGLKIGFILFGLPVCICWHIYGATSWAVRGIVAWLKRMY